MKHKRFSIDVPWPEWRPTSSAVRHWLPSRGNLIFGFLLVGLLLWAQTVGAIPLPSNRGAETSTSGTIAY